ncbi:MAG: DUF420 domain-containing protein [Candidatus Methylomirabilales bacterium]
MRCFARNDRLRSPEYGGVGDVKDRLVLPGIGLISILVLLGVAFILVGRQAMVQGSDHISGLPAVNAFLNGTSAVLLTIGYLFIRRKKVTSHKICMVTAFGVSCLFLVSYLIHHYQVGSIPFTGQGWIRPVYFTLLISHVILAALVVPLALTTLYRALSAQFDTHAKIARWTLPIWLYVSVTGVLVYVMLYQLYPAP